MTARKDSGNGRDTKTATRRNTTSAGTAKADRAARPKADRATPKPTSTRSATARSDADPRATAPTDTRPDPKVRLDPGPDLRPPFPVKLTPASWGATADQNLWTIIRNRTDAINFHHYSDYVDRLLAERKPHVFAPGDTPPQSEKGSPLLGSVGYDFLRTATEFFLMSQVGLLVQDYLRNEHGADQLQPRYDQSWAGSDEQRSELLRRSSNPLPEHWLVQLRDNYLQRLEAHAEPRVLPYLETIMEGLADLPLKAPGEVIGDSYGVDPARLVGPLGIELFWVYWHEEAMVQQSHNVIIRRFQNLPNTRRRPDPLARFELDSLRPLNNILWGWIQDKGGTLSVQRRDYEYQHEYGLRLIGKAAGNVAGVDNRSQFVSAFHNLLHQCTEFYEQDDNLTVQSDGFPLLSALQETQLVVTAGADNQYGDLPWTARVETLMQLWMLGRPEMREFLGGRPMVPYKERWMDRVDTMKSIMDWDDVNVTHFRDLGVFGEQLLLSIRYGSWATQNEPVSAVNWARYWRPEIQGYIHAYRAATGVDLRQGVDTTMPSELLAARADQRASTAGRELMPPRRVTLGGYDVPGSPVRSIAAEPQDRHLLP
ncbi:hypothetical protein [Micromonospora cathayae]|uniref:Uncharacterized protein n=1 Tax=Micromonospora cathayae TaxID=3028804 RepID=A0ABY7ZLC3_9ACTN|nr:hypothetical protein [Micromonospora sp. HUAS 3]WDZ82898.1 hypothetical protein PVK37_20760 [Micromonospora sp. HUAS 3]